VFRLAAYLIKGVLLLPDRPGLVIGAWSVWAAVHIARRE
jgi:hypothetical protein